MQWQEQYCACVFESDIDRLEKLVFDTEDAIFIRFQQLVYEPGATDEEETLKQAAFVLLELKVKKLGWPDPMRVNQPN